MQETSDKKRITVFGGTGFLGRRVVERLLGKGFEVCVASRHPERLHEIFASDVTRRDAVKADLLNPSSLGLPSLGRRQS